MSSLPALRVPHRARRLLVAAGLTASLLSPAAALASGGDAVIRDCTDDGRLSKNYTQKQYADALKNIPTDVDEYTDCRDVIRRAQLAGAGGHGGGGGGGSTTGGGAGGGATGGGTGGPPPATADQALQGASPDERAAVDQLRTQGGDVPVQVGERSLTPSDLSRTDLGALSTVPTPLLIVLVLLVLAALAGGASAIVNLVRTHRSAPGA